MSDYVDCAIGARVERKDDRPVRKEGGERRDRLLLQLPAAAHNMV